METEAICPALVRKNLLLAELGQDLTVPLARLNRNCEFKKEWNKIQRKWHGETPEVKARKKAYYQTPEVKARLKAYHKAYYERNKEKILSKLSEERRNGQV